VDWGIDHLRLLVYEHVSGGGCADESIPPIVLCEGFAMLRTLISDFKTAGHNVTTALDSRIARLNPPIGADCVVPVSSRETRANLHKIAEQVDAAYIIAPETDGVLRSLVELVDQKGTTSLNCSASAIEKVSNKTFFYNFVKKMGLRTPETMTFSTADDLMEMKKAVRGSYPLIFKPANGVGGCGLSLVRNQDHVAEAVEKIRRETSSTQFVAQDLIAGAAASVSLLSTGREALAISLNRQDVKIKTPEASSSYNGGSVPFDHPLRAEASEVAEKIVESFRNLRGYVGVDFVLTKDDAVAIEVNPRLTTSYVGLRSVAHFNIAQAIVNAVLKRELPTQNHSCGYKCFSKLETPNPSIDALQRTYGMTEVVSPPFPVSKASAVSALIATYDTTSEKAEARCSEAKKRVLNTISGGKYLW
jgi:predicted ATP-grasp superfamily ATP-dependent carboligase